MRLPPACLIICLALTGQVWAQEEKAEILVSNDRGEPITMRFSYAFRNATWKLTENTMPVDTDLTYRFPSNIPGCEKLHEWGIADGVPSRWNERGLICEKRVSLCDKATLVMNVRETECVWRQSTARR